MDLETLARLGIESTGYRGGRSDDMGEVRRCPSQGKEECYLG